MWFLSQNYKDTFQRYPNSVSKIAKHGFLGGYLCNISDPCPSLNAFQDTAVPGTSVACPNQFPPVSSGFRSWTWMRHPHQPVWRASKSPKKTQGHGHKLMYGVSSLNDSSYQHPFHKWEKKTCSMFSLVWGLLFGKREFNSTPYIFRMIKEFNHLICLGMSGKSLGFQGMA